MSYTYAAVTLGNTPKVHLGIKYSDASPWYTRCASGGNRNCEKTDEPITCIHCLTRYPPDLYLFRAGLSRWTPGS